MSIQERRTSGGIRYDVKLRDPSGRQYSRTFRTKREAVAFEASERNSRMRGSWLDPRAAETPFVEVAQRWLMTGVGKRTKTLVRDRGIVERHLLPTLGHRPIGSIRNSDIQTLINNWVAAGLSPTTIARHKAVLSAIFNLAVNDDILGRSPIRGLRLPRTDHSRGRILTTDESRRLLAAVRSDAYAPLFLLMTTGMRWSELAGLDIRHVNLMSRTPTLTIEQGAHETGGGTEITPTKSVASNRVLCLAPEQVEVISANLRNTGRTGADGEQPLFVTPMGRRLSYRNFHSRVWVPAITAAGLAGLRIHDMRKTAATRLLHANLDQKTVTAMLGHEDLQTTLKHYARATESSLTSASHVLVDGVTSQDEHAMDHPDAREAAG